MYGNKPGMLVVDEFVDGYGDIPRMLPKNRKEFNPKSIKGLPEVKDFARELSAGIGLFHACVDFSQKDEIKRMIDDILKDWCLENFDGCVYFEVSNIEVNGGKATATLTPYLLGVPMIGGKNEK